MPQAPTAALSARLDSVRRRLIELELEALVVIALPNILYLTNFSGTSAILVVTADRVLFLTDSRYVAAVAATRGQSYECPQMELIEVEGSYDARLAEVLIQHDQGADRSSGRRVGFEAAHLTVSRLAWLERAIDGKLALVSTVGVVESARVVKDASELATLRRAGRLLSDVTRDILRAVGAGQSERDLALDIDWRLRRAGFERTAFETIVASGPNAALPHARPTERTLSEGDLVVLDFGGVYDSYCVDLTRTVSIGPASPRARQVYAAVLNGHDQALAAVRPGASRFAVDEAARTVLEQEGMGTAFAHGTGHGLGLEVHEDPRITRRRSDVDTRDESLVPGMVFTIEPGAYFPGWGGVRIEDDVVVTAGGAELLTDASTALLEL
jgi:Xaa-Pro aminopeptidase/Xaa-Pro dipeptidase